MSAPSNSTAAPDSAWRTPTAVWMAVLLLTTCAEVRQWLTVGVATERLTGWLAGREADWLPFLPLLLAAPLFAWFVRSRPAPNSQSRTVASWWRTDATASPGISFWICSFLILAFGTSAARLAGSGLAGLPPAFHDEFSYLFQAQTFLAGRWSYPSFAAAPELFDQMHVLNEGRFASRYFPGTGAWLAPFVAVGDPWFGMQLAHGLCAMLMFWIGRELSSNAVGLVAAVMFALSPGVLLFSNLLLAHLPTLVGLLLFTWSYLRWMRTRSVSSALIAGVGLSFAMLCRPMTAAAFGLPFGIHFARWLFGRGRPKVGQTSVSAVGTSEVAGDSPSFPRRSLHALAMAAPLCAGFIVLMIQNLAITGSPLTSPYQMYTDLHTPRHVYGFNNVVRGEQHLGPEVIENYDRWAKNLTPALAVENAWTRLRQSFRWTLGIVPLCLGAGIGLLSLRRQKASWRLIALSILSLHVAHIPYWFEGIMGWHYVFETAPLWILLFALGTCELFRTWTATGHAGLKVWWVCLVVLTCGVNLLTVCPQDPDRPGDSGPAIWPGRLPVGLAEIEYPRRMYARFRGAIENHREGRDAIVFVLTDPFDVSIDFVANRPDLTGPVLVARVSDPTRLPEYAKLFPDRVPLVFDAAAKKFQPLPE